MPATHVGEDKQTDYTKAIRLIMPLLSRDGSMPAEAPRNVLQILAAADERNIGQKIDPTSTYTNDYLDPPFLLLNTVDPLRRHSLTFTEPGGIYS